MTQNTGTSPAVPTRSEPDGDPWAAMFAACAEVDRLAGELTLAISELDYDGGARLRVELERGLAQLTKHAEAIPMTRLRDDAIAMANEKRAVAEVLLAIAPMPSPDARDRAEAGDRERWNHEAHRWVTECAPELLTELAATALEFGGVEGALKWLGNTPSVARCRALRVLARATMNQGDARAALVLYECAIAAAAILKAPLEEATALQAVGRHALRGRHADRAASGFRRALELVAKANALQALHLRASLHHDLAAALYALGDGDGAETHALAAYGLHSMTASPLMSEDLALLAQIRAGGGAPTASDDSHHGSAVAVSPMNPGSTAIRSRQVRRIHR